MRSRLFLCLPVLLLPAVAFAADADPKPIAVVELNRKDPVTYAKDIEPILNAKCSTCHNSLKTEGKLDMSSYELLMKGGGRGSPIIPGASAGSLLVKLCGRTEKPTMPPKRETPLAPEELALVKLWIDQGAKAPAVTHQRPKVVVSLPPANVEPVRGVAVSPDKSAVVASRGNQIHVYDAGSGAYVRSLIDPELKTPDGKPVQAAHLSLVESLAYSPDGKIIASGAYQEVILWDAQTGKIRKRLTGFADRVVALAFSSNGKLLATGGGAPPRTARSRSSIRPPATWPSRSRTATATRFTASASAPTTRCWPPAAPTSSSRRGKCRPASCSRCSRATRTTSSTWAGRATASSSPAAAPT